VRHKLFWKLGLSYLALLLLLVLAVDIYAGRALRRDYLRAGFEHLESLARLVEGHPPRLDASPAAQAWAEWMARSGVRATIIAADGTVLADSHSDPRQMENHGDRPEVRQALAEGRGRDTRYSSTLRRELLYLAVRRDEGTARAVVRMALPLAEIDADLAAIRRRLWGASLVVLLLGGAASLLVSRRLACRVEQLKEFSRRVAEGRFGLLPVERAGDELVELARALNETARRLEQTIQSLTDERNRSAAILASMVEGLAVVDGEQHVLFCNQAFCRAVGSREAECVGWPLVEVIRQPELLRGVAGAIAEGRVEHAELVVNARTFAVSTAPVRAGGTSGAVLVLHDISELRRLERVRRDFVANVSHELKTPLTAIQGFAETLLAGALDDAQNRRRFLEIIRDHAMRLGRMTDELLKLAAIEAGQLAPHLRAVSLPDVLEPCVELAEIQARARGLRLDVEVPANLPAVRGDAGQLQEVLQNLLDNAVQYTPPGGRILVRALARDHEMEIVVSDTGIGIPHAEQPRIFERFYRVDPARSRDAGGTGLGLAIAKHIVEAHGGRIWVESQVGQGSHFHVVLPLAR